ncbi:MAG: DEAD/DEAH box helicase, partial [Lachnospiraceae bacterium]|nr:DEAD/DEAH box helicase [Lachnospiraceae bacterium]
MLPSILAKQLQKGIGDYIETTFPMTNEPFKGSVKKLLDTSDSVFHEPYVAVRLPFRVAEQMPTCFEAIHPAYLPYVHQERAFERLTGDDGRSTLIATGTGSGKTECFLYPILEYCYQHRGEKGIKALIIYPMNALASDQAKRIADLIWNSPELRGNVTAGMYVGGREESPNRMMSDSTIITDKETMLNHPPDILLTNYKMLDYLLVRPKDALLWQDNNRYTLKYIAVDEFHTFDGAQGTDLACLLRRLKKRLDIDSGYLCCVGTSATMGSKDSADSILTYASEVFGERFEEGSVITEDRLTPSEFFDESEINEFTMPDAEAVSELGHFVAQDEEDSYLDKAVHSWFDGFNGDIFSDEGRIELGKLLMHHNFVQAVISLTGGNYAQAAYIADELKSNYPVINEIEDKEELVYSLFALISHARTGAPGHLRPFLFVQVQLWMRELRRLLAKVSGNEVVYSIAHDLNNQQAKQYLPVVNCRDCGATGWVTKLNERNNATMTNLDAFYNLYFKGDDSIAMLFPFSHEDHIPGMIPAKICPDCLQVKLGEDGSDQCDSCGGELIEVQIPSPIPTTGSKDNKQYVCPCCGSRRGLSLMGLRSATEISTSISQMFASRFNDDKKTLAFSDNVQDAAHRAGFFNSRTWRFGLRTAIQNYVQNGGAGQNLTDFTKGFIAYWHGRLSNEAFVSFFIAPNMTWMKAYEDMKENRKLKMDYYGKKLIADIELRISYEIMLEYGLTAKIGRTLAKSGCSVMAFELDAVSRIAEAVQEKTVNELAVMQGSSIQEFRNMVIGFLNIMRMNGAFDDEAFYPMVRNGGNTYMLSNDQVRWMPGRQSGRNTPRFLVNQPPKGKGKYAYDTVGSRKYTDWLESCCSQVLIEESNFKFIAEYILAEAIKEGLIQTLPAQAEYSVYGLNKERVYITDQVTQMRCDGCGSIYAVASDEIDFWQSAPCQNKNCSGTLEVDENAELGYYGRLYSAGDMTRINAREHTGLLERDDREQLEIDFKRSKDSRKLWDPNVLSCTPTLEMGIDIGDLSTVILCSMPPAQAQFLQRAGRAGRKDGNALTLTVANARPHDLFFYADPMDMIAGNVQSPKIFLKASAVLERQFVAYCMDSWVKSGIGEQVIPKHVDRILGKLRNHPQDVFPFNFFLYVQNNLSVLINSFISMFSTDLDTTTRAELRKFAQGDKLSESPMHIQVLESFQNLKKQRDSLQSSIKELESMIKELESKPKDSSYEEEIQELKSEQRALQNVYREINRKDVFNFLSDEGLLPNYAFPESGIILKAVLYRKEEPAEQSTPVGAKKKYEKMVYEYSRGASAAISEFAPLNNFYVDGRKLTVNQIDLTTAQPSKWRLCPNCSHAQIEEVGRNTASCPRCGSPAWSDSGQVRTMLRVQMVYSNMDYTQSLIGDESDDRSNVFYTKQLLVDVDEDHDIASAYQMNNDEFPFGYEFVRNAVLREINFGESDMVGEKLLVSGVEEVRKGFKICKYCGTIQSEHEKRKHTAFCKIRKNPVLDADPFEECLFLYREFQTEILRLLIPATTMDASKVRTESFVAAFMLGMKEYFGNVDHLRATVSEVPVPDADYRKQYLVIYDSVPGGTGYLKQLMHEKDALTQVFEKALAVMENCSCKDDPQKDGCYHCLFAYRQSQNIGNVSRSAAICLLKAILSGKDNIEKIDRLSRVSVNPLFDSELERRFIEAMNQMGNDSRKVSVSKALVNNKEGYVLKVNDAVWEIEPQVILDAEQGVSVKSKPDFVIWPVKADGRKHYKYVPKEGWVRSGIMSHYYLPYGIYYDQYEEITEEEGYVQHPAFTEM